MLHYAYYANEVRSFDEVDTGATVTFKPVEAELADKLIAQLTIPEFNPDQYKDEYVERVNKQKAPRTDPFNELTCTSVGATCTTRTATALDVGTWLRVAVTATSHKAIHNLLDNVIVAAREARVEVRGLKKTGSGDDRLRGERSGVVEAGEDDTAIFVRDGRLRTSRPGLRRYDWLRGRGARGATAAAPGRPTGI
jgi:hypothetical protein